MSVLICTKLFDTLIVVLKEFFEKVNFEKKSQQRKTKHRKMTQHANSKKCPHFVPFEIKPRDLKKQNNFEICKKFENSYVKDNHI